MGASLKSIADDLGLSKATVSWILSGQGEEKGFSSSTIKQVKDYSKKVGYRPNLIARSLSIGYTNTIALIIPSIGDLFYSQMAQAVEEKATGSGYVMILGSSEGDEKKERDLIQTLRSQQVAGLIVAPTNKSDKTIAAMLKEKFPFVLIDRYVPELHSSYVIVDNENSSYDLVRHLAASGCKRIAILTTDTHLYVMGRRMAGYVKAINESGLETGAGLVMEIDRADYMNDVSLKLDLLFRNFPDVDGFFFATHYLAEEAVKYFIKNNIDYHVRFKLACIHTTSALDILVPDMSRAVMPIGMMGAKAVEILLKNISSGADFIPEESVLENSRSLF